MVKGKDVGFCLRRLGFGNLRKSSDETSRFCVSARHQKHAVQVEIHAPTGRTPASDKRRVVIKITGARDRTLPGVEKPVIARHLREVEKVLQDIKNGEYSREVAA